MSIKEVLNKLFGIETYTIKVVCTNCDYEGELKLEKGKRLDFESKCPKCRCQDTLVNTSISAYVKHLTTPKVNKEEKCQDKQE